MDIVLPDPYANRYLRDLKLLGKIVHGARNTYRDNYPTTPIMDGDIKELTGKDFLDLTKLKEGENESIAKAHLTKQHNHI